MRMIRALHVSDIHGHFEKTQPIEARDHLRKEVTNQFRPSSYAEQFNRAIKHNVEICGRFDAILCTGDVGNRTLEMQDGLDFLGNLARICEVEPKNVLISPGNHDVNRKATSPEESIKVFSELCIKMGFLTNSSEHPVTTDLLGTRVIILNSCVGANARISDMVPLAYYQKAIQEAELNKTIIDITSIGPDYDYQMEMDVPGISITAIDEVESIIESSGRQFVLILMHHNLMPSRVADIRPYANIVDGGPLLDALIRKDSGILILHGHTHNEQSYVTTVPIQKGRANSDSFIITSGIAGIKGFRQHAAAASIVEVYLTDKGSFLGVDFFPVVFQSEQFVIQKQPSIIRNKASLREAAATMNAIKDSEDFFDYSEIQAIAATSNLTPEDIVKVLVLGEHNEVSIDRKQSRKITDWSFRVTK